MARPRKYSTEELLAIIEKYLNENEYITKLTYADLERYSQKLGYTNITRKDFSRNEESKKFLEEYNRQNDLSMYINLNDNSENLSQLSFKVEDVIEKNISNKKQLIAIFKIFKESYDKAFLKIDSKNKDIEKLKEKISELNENNNKLNENNKILKEQLKEINEKNKNNKSSKKVNAMYSLLKYIVDNKNVPLETEEDIQNILKNLISVDRTDIVNEEEIISSEFNIKIEETINEKMKIKEEKIIPINKNKSKLKLPNFLKE